MKDERMRRGVVGLLGAALLAGCGGAEAGGPEGAAEGGVPAEELDLEGGELLVPELEDPGSVEQVEQVAEDFVELALGWELEEVEVEPTRMPGRDEILSASVRAEAPGGRKAVLRLEPEALPWLGESGDVTDRRWRLVLFQAISTWPPGIGPRLEGDELTLRDLPEEHDRTVLRVYVDEPHGPHEVTIDDVAPGAETATVDLRAAGLGEALDGVRERIPSRSGVAVRALLVHLDEDGEALGGFGGTLAESTSTDE